jgi:bifunctional DNA-binding transcriptional regulator/antitoxin component of YhaV-PrlF toxin-antitoxin module
MPLVTMQAKGQMTVPQALREALGIETGTQLVCFQSGPDAFECHVLPKPMSVDELIERFSSPDPVPTPEEMQAIVRDGILAEARTEAGWTDESWDGEPRAG